MLAHVPSESWLASGEKRTIPQNHSTTGRIFQEVKVAVQVRIDHIWAGERKVQAGGYAERCFIHAANHGFQPGCSGNRIYMKRLGNTADLHEFHIDHVG